MSAAERPLYVAAGGGGDALGALMVALGDGLAPERTHIATFAWERIRFDPRPGPRAPADFDGLESVCPDVWRLASASRLRRGRSFLPDLVRATGCNLYLLDPSSGVRGLREQLTALSGHIGSEITMVVDVGGDILARGREDGLRSPTADAMALAAAAQTGLRMSVIAFGLGLDGELTRRQWRAACRSGARSQAGPVPERTLNAAAARLVRRWLAWHPSEVTGLACLAALGYRGRTEVRSQGVEVTLDAEAAVIHEFEHAWLMARNRVAQAVSDTTSWQGIVAAVREAIGRSELDDETEMLARRNRYRTAPLAHAELARQEARLLDYSEDAAARGVSFMTLRRVSEMLALSPRPFAQLRKRLRDRHPDRLQPPVWRCGA